MNAIVAEFPRHCAALRLPLSQAVGLISASLRISKLLLPLVAKPAKAGPVSLFALGEPVDHFEVDLGAALIHDRAESLPPLVPGRAFQVYLIWTEGRSA
jgi:hypothetical protein